MSLTVLEKAIIGESFGVAKRLLDETLPVLERLNTMYNSGGGLSSTITQGELDEVPGYSGITKQQLDDGLYALTSSVRSALNTAFDQLTQLAARS